MVREPSNSPLHLLDFSCSDPTFLTSLSLSLSNRVACSEALTKPLVAPSSDDVTAHTIVSLQAEVVVSAEPRQNDVDATPEDDKSDNGRWTAKSIPLSNIKS